MQPFKWLLKGINGLYSSSLHWKSFTSKLKVICHLQNFFITNKT